MKLKPFHRLLLKGEVLKMELGVEGSSKKEKGLMDIDNSVVIAGEGVKRWGGGNGEKRNRIARYGRKIGI